MSSYEYWEDRNPVLYKGLKNGLSERDIIIDLCKYMADLNLEYITELDRLGYTEALMNGLSRKMDDLQDNVILELDDIQGGII